MNSVSSYRGIKNSAVAVGFTVAAAFLFAFGAMALPPSAVAQSTDREHALSTRTFIDLSKQVLPSVVSIEVKRQIARGPERQPRDRPPDFEDFLRRFFDQGPGAPPLEIPELDRTIRAAGSGFFFRVDGTTGFVMTNNHVIDRTRSGEISIILDTTYGDAVIDGDRVEILGRDTLGDLAVLKVELGDIRVVPISWGDSDRVAVGEWVLALGNPLELRNSVTQGIVSSKHRKIGQMGIEDLLQTTASINPGNSGGPLVNLDGKVVGINNAIATRTGMWQGVAFAIPSNYAREIADQIVDTGKVSRGYLGIQMEDLNRQIAAYFEIDREDGIIVRGVQEGTAAEQGGVQPYDIIVRVDDKPVKDTADMLRLIATKPVGATVELHVLRDVEDNGQLQEVTLVAVLGERPSDDELSSIVGGPALERRLTDRYGLSFNEVASAEEGGLVIETVERGGLAANAGLRPGDVILQVNRLNVTTVDEFNQALQRRPADREHLILYRRSGMNNFTTMAAPRD